jgi:hypothetical protein
MSPFGKHGLRKQDNIEMDFDKVGWWIADFIRLAQYRNQWRTVLNKIINFKDPCNTGSF